MGICCAGVNKFGGTACAHESFWFKMSLVCPEVASAGPEPSDEGWLAVCKGRAEAGEDETGRGGGDGADR